MKKIILSLSFLFAFSIWCADAQITSYPYLEDFESGDGGWLADNTNGGTWALGAPAAGVINSADSGSNAWVTNLTGNYNNNDDSFVVSPVFDLTSLAAPSIELSVWWNSEFSWDGMVLQSSIDSGASWQNVGAFGDPNNWYTDNTIAGNPGGQQEGWTGRAGSGSGGWVVARHALTGLAGESNVILRVAFGSDGSVQDEGVAFDTVSIFDVTCPEPTGITISGITSTTADISWTAAGSETNWEVVVQPLGTGVPTGPGVSTTNNPYTATGLAAVTDYEVYVRADCGANGFSNWVGAVNFLSACDVFTPDYLESFTTIIPNCWDEASDGDATTGPQGLGAGDWNQDGFLNNGFEGAYSINLWLAAKSDWILSPQFDLTGGPFQVDFDFGIMQFGSSDNAGTLGSDDTVQLLISTDNGGTWTSLVTFDNTSTVPATGTQVVFDLTAYSGQIVQFGILGSEGTVDDPEDNEIFVDNFRVRAIPSCQEPTGLTLANVTDTSADIGWTPGGAEASWEVAVQPQGTGVPTGAGLATTNNPYTATPLTPSTAYEVWVRADCGVDGLSSWIGPINFTTLNTPPPPPVGVTCASGSSSFIFTENFDQDPPAGWTGTGFDGSDGNWDITAAGANSFGTGPANAFDGGAGTHLEYEASGNSSTIASAISPAIDLTTALDGAELSFFFHAFGDDMGTLNVGISNDVAGPFTNVFTWIGDLQTSDAEAWVPVGINIDAYLGQVIYLEFSYGGAGTGFEGDMSIDFIRVESCGNFCIPPSGITVTNITGTTADIAWDANSGETSWEYVVVPAGTGEPTGAGTTVGTPSASITGLSFETDYEVWVRADCGSQFSIWAGPVNFTTTIQTNFDVDCAVGPVMGSVCYGNNDSEVFTYTSSDGSPLNLTFNAGEIEGAPFDFLVVFDSDGVTELYNDEGNNGDISGLTFQSTGDTISFQIQSDGSVSCASGSFCCSDGIDYTVACATCINPDATYQVVDDCANGDQFLVDVNVTSLGDATSLTISNNIDATTVPVTTPGTYQIGPFPFLVDVIVTVSNDQDVNCVINSSAIQLLACPPANDNPCNATVAVVNDDETCDLTTSGTLIEATPSGVPDGSCAGNPDDDVWFEFTALSEVQLISLVNIQGGGFNTDHALYEGTCDGLIELECTDGTASVTPSLTVGNTYFIRVFSGGNNSETTTFDLCIKEAPTNIICENAENFCAEVGGSLTTSNIIGIPDPTDIACLFSAPNPTWNIIQIGDPGLIEIQIDQVDENGNGLDVDFVLWGPFASLDDACGNLDLGCPNPGGDCPNNTGNPNFYPFGNIVDCSYSAAPTENLTIDNAISGEIYVLLVTNFSDDAGTISISQTNTGGPNDGDITAEIEVDLGPDQNFCGFPDFELSADSPFADTYEWYENGFIIPGETGPTLTVSASNTYTVIAFDEQCDAQAQDTVTLNFGDEPIANAVNDIITCDDISADEIEDFDLEIQTAGILGAQASTDFNVTYHLSLADAQADTGALTSPYTNISNPQTIFARIEDASAEFCFATTSFDLIISGPTPDAASVPIEECDDDSDGIALFDLAAHDVNVLDGQNAVDFTVTYYETESDAETGSNAIDTSALYSSGSQTIYTRVESNIAFDCFSTTPFDLVVKPIPSVTFTTDFDYEVCPNATVPIEITATANNFDVSEVTITWYQDGGVIAGENGLTLPVLEAGLYEIEVTFNDTTQCSSITAQDIIELESCVIPQGISPNGDGFNDTFDLSSYDVTKLEIFNRNGTLVYSKTNYTNEWYGQSNDGDELPVGTYFYTMEYENGKRRSAWVYIQRLN
ncbi:gliding motility-associated C-terminal domain-containing protein [Formosa sp. Hel1_31_208]|uniref:fibronectin type III domain-containing protein n=1 Tax=Formosa sp. Hel1_31_208 TaxID=1798225 RepID=UPI00087AF499|nr:fibronectin type III domain-containing protein [Formosa sp. Hel1_31_208]SDR70502.1 gliding motility-associated C-terminal domain-containing protein [Formosa sp. Hel1_31_208]